MLSVYLQGLSLGLAYVAPIGMQNIFVIHSAMRQRLRRTLATALIVIFWDVSLGLACFLSVGALMAAVPWLQRLLLGVGGLLVLCIGAGLVRAKPVVSDGEAVERPLWKMAGTAFVVTWLNPQALIDGTLMLGAFRACLPVGGEPYFITGFACASCLWFLGLALVVHVLGSKLDPRALTWLNRLCGAVILLYGVKLLCTLGQQLLA